MSEQVPVTDDVARHAAPSLALRAVIWYQRTFTGGAPTCRFYPSCSSYAREALEVHGTRRGLWLTTRRLLRCRPFGPSGVDPVPLPHSTDRDRSLVRPDSEGHPVSGKAC